MEKPFKLADNICNYLNYLNFIKNASPLTIKHYTLDLEQAFKAANKNSPFPSELTEEELLNKARGAFNQWAPLSLASKNRKAATLKSFLSWAFDEGLTQKDLSQQITCPKVPQKIPHFLSVDEAIAVLKSFDEENKHRLKEKVLFLLLYGGGLRISEACNLKWADIQMAQKVLRAMGKGSKERIVALPTLTIQTLQHWRKENAFDEFVFGTAPLNQRTAYEMIRQSGRRARLLKPLHPHALRHSFATHLLSSGANLRILQELLGHESLRATEKYTHLGIDHLARTMEAVHPLGQRDEKRNKGT
ncbi:MAG: tyrosine-type recombinase/integrase [Pseudobdellovibrionaceae bacterium]